MTDPTDSMQMRRAELQLLRTLPELLTHHLEHRPQIPVYMQYDNRVKQWQTLTVQDTYERVMRWAHAFAALGLKRGERVAMLLPNGIDAICFDMAALLCLCLCMPSIPPDPPLSSCATRAHASLLRQNSIAGVTSAQPWICPTFRPW